MEVVKSYNAKEIQTIAAGWNDGYSVLLTTCRPYFLKPTEHLLPMFVAGNDHHPKAALPDEAGDRTKVALHPPRPLPGFP